MATKTPSAVQPRRGVVAWWTVVYAVVACSLGLVNKGLAEWYHFRAFNLLSVVTRILALPLVWAMADGKVNMLREVTVALRHPSWLLLAPTIFRSLETVVSFMAVQWTNVPMYLVLRRANTLFALVGEAVILRKSIPLASLEGVVVILLGTALAGYGDLTYDFFGYVAALSQNCFTTASNVCMYRLTHEASTPCKVEVALFIQTLFSIPLLLGLVLWTGELSVPPSAALYGPSCMLLFILFVHVLLVGLHQISNTMSIVQGGPVSTSVAGNCKDVVQTVTGGMLFDDYVYDHCNVAGICLSFAGCALYIRSKLTTAGGGEQPRVDLSGRSVNASDKGTKLA
ncbi:hypothetical protein FOZ63_033916 [Perkinsus olseni]|uniref:Sugar phosphate transporter domain-containing protein n=1 Tax=Perkinsus olseni TaxID=32597 RepID=A0A7J6SKV2_PEROL|nr:hypothetical protein FOZ63_033916 [Perkinsus olseni]